MPNPTPQPLTPTQLEAARRDLTELTGGAWYAPAAAWAGPLLATVLALQKERTEFLQIFDSIRQTCAADEHTGQHGEGCNQCVFYIMARALVVTHTAPTESAGG